MKLNFAYLIIGGLMSLGIIWKEYKYYGNPIFASYNLTFWILAILMFIGAYLPYKYENY